MAIAQAFMKSKKLRSNLNSLRAAVTKASESLDDFESFLADCADSTPPHAQAARPKAHPDMEQRRRKKRARTPTPDEAHENEFDPNEWQLEEEEWADEAANTDFAAGYEEEASGLNQHGSWAAPQGVKYGPDTTPCRGPGRWVDPNHVSSATKLNPQGGSTHRN